MEQVHVDGSSLVEKVVKKGNVNGSSLDDKVANGAATCPPVIAFVGSVTGAEDVYGGFSNTYRHQKPFQYKIAFGAMEGTEIAFCHANKALHCTKASIFNDKDNFKAINEESDPSLCTKLGRDCKGFEDSVWNGHVNAVIDDILFHKFSHEDDLAKLLLSTGDAHIGNATNNPTWGTGFSKDHPDGLKKELWTGKNIQGHALMRLRDRLGGERASVQLPS